MARDSQSGKLAVILHADVIDSTRMVQLDEQLLHQRIQDTFRSFSDTISEYSGRVLESRGDAILAEFERPSDAVSATLAFQQTQSEYLPTLSDEIKPEVRVGIALGEVVIADNTVTGAGVVLAQRIEQLANPGGLCITAAIHEALSKRFLFDFEDLGERKLKGFDHLVRIYKVLLKPGSTIPQPEKTISSGKSQGPRRISLMITAAVLIVAAVSVLWIKPWQVQQQPTSVDQVQTPIAQKTSVAVLPFSDMSNAKEQEYFAEGIVEDIITDLSKVSGLRVVAFRDDPPTRQDLADKYSLGFLLSGSVRKLEDRVRINIQLVDIEDGSNIWTERYDRKLEDVFDLQEEVAQQVVSALSLELTGEELNQLSRHQTANFDAYDAFLQGQRHSRNVTRESNLLARQLFERAIQLDPDFARAYGALSVNHAVAFRRSWSEDPDTTLEIAIYNAEKAESLDGDSPHVLWALGYSYLFNKEYQKAAGALEKAIHIAPSYADGYGLLALINNNLGRYQLAAEQIREAMLINPVYTFEYPYLLGRAQYGLGRYEEAIEALSSAIERNETALAPHLYLAASFIGLGQQDDAEWEIEQVLVLDPEYTTTKYESIAGIAKEDELKRFLDDLRKAGLPD